MAHPDSSSTVQGSVPWYLNRNAEDPFEDFDANRLMVFVPAIMSVGLVFSVVTLMRDLFKWTGGRARRRRTMIEAGAVLSDLLGEPEPDPEDLGLLNRPSYLISALVLVGGATYIAIGSAANFLRDQGYVRDIGWLLALSLSLALALGFLGGVALAVFRSWPHPPSWTMGALRVAPLTTTPGTSGAGPSWAITSSLWMAAVVTGMVSLLVGSGRSIARDIDEPIARWMVEAEWINQVRFLDVFGSTVISIGFVALIGFAVFRCRVIALTYPVAFLGGWIGGAIIREIVDRPRPADWTDVESFPSGHMVQAVFIAGLVPLAVKVLFDDNRLATVSRYVLGIAVVVSGLYRVHRQSHWPLDIVGGVAVGLTVVLAVYWAMGHRQWHEHCNSCPWSPQQVADPWRRGLFQLSPRSVVRLKRAGVGLALTQAALLALGTVTVGLPTDPEGYGFGSAISGPVQIGLAALVGIGGLVAIRYRPPGLFLMALAATGLGLFASVQYRPTLAVALTAALLVPAILTWLAWQPTETVGTISVLAAITISVLTATSLGAREVYGFYFGPTHPESAADDLELDEGSWAWLGAMQSTSAVITVGGIDDDLDTIDLWYWPADADDPSDASEVVSAPVDHDSLGLARFELTELEPATTYSYQVSEPEDEPDWAEPPTFTTFADGPQNIVIAAASCARSGSNGAVFDAILAEQPNLYLALGDLHYANLESDEVSAHVGQYGGALSQDGQAALFSSTPTAYVWDDHDYGPDNADRFSPSRLAVSTAYRQAVPHYGVDPDPEGSIAQAFTIGRVRFVLTDTRSMRSPTTMLGAEQVRWLTDELTASAKTHALVIWANPTPWISTASSIPGVGDDWGAYAEERRTIADALAEAEVDNLIMVSGDAHMVAIDDGSNSGYSSDGEPGFPILHAGALDRPGSVKGGPYSHGTYPGGGQYGVIEIIDDGGETIEVELRGHTWDGNKLVGLDLSFAVP